MAKRPAEVVGHSDIIPCQCHGLPFGTRRATPPPPRERPGDSPPGTGEPPSEAPAHAAHAAHYHNLPAVQSRQGRKMRTT